VKSDEVVHSNRLHMLILREVFVNCPVRFGKKKEKNIKQGSPSGETVFGATRHGEKKRRTHSSARRQGLPLGSGLC
jgi:hypothetical protein